MRTALLSVSVLLMVAVVSGIEWPRSLFADASVKALTNWRLQLFLQSGEFPERTHFDGLDWEVGFTEVLLYAVRAGGWAVPELRSNFRYYETTLLEAYRQYQRQPSHHDQRLEDTWRQITKAMHEPAFATALDQVHPSLSMSFHRHHVYSTTYMTYL